MSQDVQNISAQIANKIRGVSGLTVVYDYEIDKPENGQYPFATVAQRDFRAEFGDTIRNLRYYTFTINVYQERTVTGFGNQKSERLVREICDEVLTAFDMDTTLSGMVKFVRPVQGTFEYIDREIGDTRIAQFVLECMTVVPSVT